MDHLPGSNGERMRCRGVLHIVKNGDTLYKIAKKHGVPLSWVMYANPYVDVYNLQIGDEICVPMLGMRPPIHGCPGGCRPPMHGCPGGCRPPMHGCHGGICGRETQTGPAGSETESSAGTDRMEPGMSSGMYGNTAGNGTPSGMYDRRMDGSEAFMPDYENGSGRQGMPGRSENPVEQNRVLMDENRMDENRMNGNRMNENRMDGNRVDENRMNGNRMDGNRMDNTAPGERINGMNPVMRENHENGMNPAMSGNFPFDERNSGMYDYRAEPGAAAYGGRMNDRTAFRADDAGMSAYRNQPQGRMTAPYGNGMDPVSASMQHYDMDRMHPVPEAGEYMDGMNPPPAGEYMDGMNPAPAGEYMDGMNPPPAPDAAGETAPELQDNYHDGVPGRKECTGDNCATMEKQKTGCKRKPWEQPQGDGRMLENYLKQNPPEK